MKRPIVLAALLLLAASLSLSAANQLSISDFAVHSDKPDYKYVGKGIAEMISVELRKSPGLELVEREKRAEILEEMEFSLSDLTDPEAQLKAGQLLAARFIIFGEIIDMGKEVLISLRMIDVESGGVVWNEKLTEKLTRYDFISGYFAKSILKHFNAKVAVSTEKKTEAKAEKIEEAVVAFSKAVDHYDKKDKKEAKSELARARKIDPKNEAVKVYIQKLEGISPKFRVETELYSPAYNPASLGFIEQDSFSFWNSATLKTPDELDIHGGAQLIDGYYLKDFSVPTTVGYRMPLGQRLGLGVSFIGGGYDRLLNTPYTFDFEGTPINSTHLYFLNVGGCVALGYRLSDNISLGASTLVWYTSPGEGTSVADFVDQAAYFAANGGLLMKGWEDRFTFDAQATYTNQKERYVDPDQQKVIEGMLPLIAEASTSLAFFDRRLFVALKSIGDFYLDDRGGYALRLVPMAELWPFPFIALRAGYENARLAQFDRISTGHGFLAGVSVKIWKLELHTNFTARDKPVHVLPGYTLKDWTLLVGGGFNSGFVSR